jgi:hypothetical protein
MAYLITTTNGTVLGQIEPQTTNTTFSSLTLIGQALENYGQYLNDDLIALTENFADSSSPINPLPGQIWYNTTSQTLNYYNGIGYSIVASEIWVEDNFVPTESFTNSSNIITNIIASSGFSSSGTKPNYSANNYILNSDSLLSAIGKLDAALAASGNESAYLTIAAAEAEYLTITNAESTYAPLVSAALTGSPTSTTPGNNNNSTRIATTAFVANNYVSNATAASTYAPLNAPNLTGQATAPTVSYTDDSNRIATTAFVNNLTNNNNNAIFSDIAATYLSITNAQTYYAALVSPGFGGSPTAPTPGTGNNSNIIATTAFVQNTITNGFTINTSENGYQKFPNGFYFQWGTFTSSGGQFVYFPIAFPNACLNVVASVYATPGDFQDVVHVGAWNYAGVNLYTGQTLYYDGTLSGGIGVTYFAIGY